MRILSLVPLACAVLAACSAASGTATSAAPSAAAADSQVVILVRHAEKAPIAAGESDPLLSAAGEQRAQALADLLRRWELGPESRAYDPDAIVRNRGIDRIFVTQYRRTQATAAPLAQLLRIVPDTFSTRATDHPAAVAAAARAHRGKALVVVGHSNSIPAIITALGAGPMADLCEAEYSNLFIVVLKDGVPPRLERRTYGEPDPPGASSCPR
jgi:broad specificity phosphatase PhoE